jgi:pimeloyl-ACP methyl ester carboxylesterase
LCRVLIPPQKEEGGGIQNAGGRGCGFRWSPSALDGIGRFGGKISCLARSWPRHLSRVNPRPLPLLLGDNSFALFDDLGFKIIVEHGRGHLYVDRPQVEAFLPRVNRLPSSVSLAKIFGAAFLLSLAVNTTICCGQILDYSATLKLKDNFLEADFRFVNPDPTTVPDQILVYIPGTDGDARGIVQDPKFLATAQHCHAALLGCYFRGEGLDYDNPCGGSGKALDEALDYFATQTKQPQLSAIPLLMMGHSQGAQFTFNYVCWRPQRVKAFAAIKAGYFLLTPQDASFQVPGLIVAGEDDESGRIQTSARAFAVAAGKHSRWAFLLEKGAGHDLAQSADFARQFIEAVCETNDSSPAIYNHAETEKSDESSSSDADICWFPDSATAETWKSLHQPVALLSLEEKPDSPTLSSVISITVDPQIYACENGQTQHGIIEVNANDDHILINRVSIAGNGFSLEGASNGKPPLQINVRFAPKELNWGCLAANLVVEGEKDGRQLEPAEFNVTGFVQGPVTPVPSLVYLGVAHPHEVVNKTVLLKPRQTGVHIIDIKSSPDMTVIVEPRGNEMDDFQINITWFPGNRLGRMSGEIQITLDQPEKGVLRIPVVAVVTRSDP